MSADCWIKMNLLTTLTTLCLLSISQDGTTWKNVIYLDEPISWNKVTEDIKAAADYGFNVINLSFLLHSGPADIAIQWTQQSKTDRDACLSYLHSKGAKLMVSAGGATEPVDSYIRANSPTGTAYGEQAASWAVEWGLDGIDFDFELTPKDEAPWKDGSAQKWIAAVNTAARQVLGSSRLISHAPQAPYFGANYSHGYTTVYKMTPDVDFFNVQFYNQGNLYQTYDTLFAKQADGSSLQQIVAQGVPQNKLVLGKPITSGTAYTGYVSMQTLASWVGEARSQYGWDGGVMTWEFLESNPITQEWGQTFSAFKFKKTQLCKFLKPYIEKLAMMDCSS